MDECVVNLRAAEPLPADLETLTILELKQLGEGRGYATCWLNGKKKADYLKWIREQHEDAVMSRDAKIAQTQLFDNMKANLGAIDNARKKAEVDRLEYAKKRDAVLEIIVKLEAVKDKTTQQYDALVTALRSVIILNEAIAKCEQILYWR